MDGSVMFAWATKSEDGDSDSDHFQSFGAFNRAADAFLTVHGFKGSEVQGHRKSEFMINSSERSCTKFQSEFYVTLDQ